MRTLHLVRHAKSSWDDPRQRDFDRPLNARGQRDAPRMARRFADAVDAPPRLVSSPARRAWSTASAFAAALDLEETAIRADASIYDASAGTLLACVNALDDTDPEVALFGHNPGFSALAQLLAPCPFSDMPTGAIASLRLDVGRWAEVAPGCGQLLDYRYPKQVE